MHILYIFGFQYSLKNWERSNSIDREFEFFKLMGSKFNATYTLVTYGNKEDCTIDLPSNINLIPLHKKERKRFKKLFDFIFSIIIPFKIYKNLDEVDLIRTNQLHGCWVAIIFKFLLRKPLFVRTGYDALLFSKHQSKNKIKQNIFYYQTFLALKYSQLYSVTSGSDLKFLRKNFKTKKFLNKIILRPNWIKSFKYSQNFLQRKDSFVTVGRLEDQKNYHFLIKSFKNTEQNLDIIGEGSQKKDLLNQISNLNLNISINSNINYNSLLKKLQGYKFFILASKYEGNPKVLLEAMSVGCIPIVSDIPNHTEIISHGKNGFIFSLSSYLSLNKILKSINSFNNLEQISINAQQYVLKNNSLTDVINREYDDYLYLISNNAKN